MKAVSLSAALLVTGLLACSGADATPMVRARAADDLTCAESTIRVVRGVGDNYTALGCGKKAKYQALCEGTYCSVSKEGEGLKSPPQLAPAPEQPR